MCSGSEQNSMEWSCPVPILQPRLDLSNSFNEWRERTLGFLFLFFSFSLKILSFGLFLPLRMRVEE